MDNELKKVDFTEGEFVQKMLRKSEAEQQELLSAPGAVNERQREIWARYLVLSEAWRKERAEYQRKRKARRERYLRTGK
jgi:predicted DNA-binding antitoxin AbrB/MazE fold protein